MKYVACYCRVSHEEQVKYGYSINAQKDALIKYCKENGYKYEFYIDEGISASSMKKRKALLDMLSKLNVFDMILFTKLDRLSRNVLDANTINKMLIENNCTMKAIDEDDVDTTTADGTFIFNLKVSLAQREIGKTSERINFVFKNKRENGQVTSGSKKYGYNIVDKRYVINKDESENIINLYKYFISVNGNIQKTYKYFIEHFPGKGQDALYNYLRETAYIGKYKLYRKEIFLENYIPRIMEDNLFYNVQNLLKKKEKIVGYNKSFSIFSGLIYCNICQKRMSKKQDNRTKNKLMRYVCDNAYRLSSGSLDHKCSNNRLIRESVIEQYLLYNLCDVVAREKTAYNLKVQVESASNTSVDNSQKIKNIENKINKLKDLYLDDLIDKETYRKDYTELNKELNALKNTIVSEIPQKDFSAIEKILNSDYKKIYNKLTTENKRKFWLSIIDKIYVENGEIKEITFL
jgi:site-specific DNA recombinase